MQIKGRCKSLADCLCCYKGYSLEACTVQNNHELVYSTQDFLAGVTALPLQGAVHIGILSLSLCRPARVGGRGLSEYILFFKKIEKLCNKSVEMKCTPDSRHAEWSVRRCGRVRGW